MKDTQLMTFDLHKAAINRLEALTDKGEAGKTSINEEKEIKYLSIHINAYEDQIPFNNLYPIKYIRYILENKNLKQQDMANTLGIKKSTLSNILNYKKKLSLGIIRSLHIHYNISYDILMIQYNLKPCPAQNFESKKIKNSKL